MDDLGEVAVDAVDMIGQSVAVAGDGEGRLATEVVVGAAGQARDVEFSGGQQLCAIGITGCTWIDVYKIAGIVHRDNIVMTHLILCHAYLAGESHVHPDIFNDLPIDHDNVMRAIVLIGVEGMHTPLRIDVCIRQIGHIVVAIVLRWDLYNICLLNRGMIDIGDIEIAEGVKDVVEAVAAIVT